MVAEGYEKRREAWRSGEVCGMGPVRRWTGPVGKFSTSNREV